MMLSVLVMIAAAVIVLSAIAFAAANEDRAGEALLIAVIAIGICGLICWGFYALVWSHASVSTHTVTAVYPAGGGTWTVVYRRDGILVSTMCDKMPVLADTQQPMLLVKEPPRWAWWVWPAEPVYELRLPAEGLDPREQSK